MLLELPHERTFPLDTCLLASIVTLFMPLLGVSIKSEAAVWRDEVCVPMSDVFS